MESAGGFAEFLVRSGALRFGEFKLKSGRLSPYFVNTGGFDDGRSIYRLGRFYAGRIHESLGDGVDLIFGPAYKGIPLALATAIALSEQYGHNVAWAFDRKEVKAHGDKGFLVGRVPQDGDRVVLLDDVFTTGATKDEAVERLSAVADVKVVAVIIAVDRQEVGPDGLSAISEFSSRTGIPVQAIATIREVFEELHGRAVDGRVWVDDGVRAELDRYLARYGVKSQ